MLHYKIAGLKVHIKSRQKNRFKRLKPFESVFSDEPDLEIEFQASGSFCVRKYLLQENSQDVIKIDTEYCDGKTILYIFMEDTDRPAYIIEADSNWSHVTLFHLESDRLVSDVFSDYLGNLILSNRLLFSDGIILHASSVSWSGKGIAFTAPSGTGKSTHTAMWVKYHKASMINDDCPAIRYINGSAFIYGTPWNGACRKINNTSAPLSAVVILERAVENSIRSLTYEEAVPMLLPRLFLPYHNPVMMDKALENIDRIFRPIPIYLLKCRPDREATELVRQCVI